MTSFHSISNSAQSPSRRAQFSALAFCTGLFFAGRTAFALVSARWFNAGSEPGVFASLGGSVLLALVIAFNAFGPSRNICEAALRALPLKWIVLYLAFSGCSLLWSASAAPTSSAIYWGALAGDVSIIVLLEQSMPVADMVHSLLKGFIAASCILSAVAWAMPVAADLRLGDLDYFNTNQIGNLCALSILMCSLLASRGDELPRIAPWLLGFTLIRSLSKSTLIAMIFCVLYRLLRDPETPRTRKWVYIGAALLLTLIFWGLLSAYYDIYTTAGNQAETLTGRTAIWTWALDAALMHPWVGNGFDAMWHVAPPFGGELFEARHAENELLQQFFAYGACGLVLLAGVYGSLYRLFRQLPRSTGRTTLIAFLVYVLVRGLAEAEPFDLLLPLWLITALAFLTVTELQTQTSRASQPAYAVSARGLPAC